MLIISLQASMLKAGGEEKSEEVRDLHKQPHPIHNQMPVSVKIRAWRFYLLDKHSRSYSTVKKEEQGINWEHVNTGSTASEHN